MQATRPGSSASSRRAGHEREQYAARGTSRSRDGSRGQAPKPPSQRAMLSRALQKANTAVQFDNVQNFTEARHAYKEANQLLYDLLQKTVQEEDRTKLEAIRRTYTSRIQELDQMAVLDSKALPAPPPDEQYEPPQPTIQEPLRPGTSSSRHRDPSSAITHTKTDSRSPGGLAPSPNLRQNGAGYFSRPGLSPQHAISPMSDNSGSLQHSFSPASHYTKSPLEDAASQGTHDRHFLPHPHPRGQPPRSPPRTESTAAGDSFTSDLSTSSERSVPRQTRGHLRSGSQNSWLDPIDEATRSRGSSVHSRTSSLGYRRRHLRGGSGDTEAEFDNALDEAIEAAYDDGYEPVTSADHRGRNEHGEEIVANALRKVEMARERVRQTEREAYEMLGRGKQQPPQQRGSGGRAQRARDEPAEGNSSEDEERMLEAMTKDYTIDDYPAEQQRIPRVPRESDSSGTTSRTWHSSVGSNPPTASTSLSPLTESSVFSSLSKPTTLPPMQSLPEIPVKMPTPSAQSVRNRRMSGHNPKQLKIETAPLVAVNAKKAANETGEITSAPTHGNEAEVPPSDTPWSHDGLTRPTSPPGDQQSSDTRHFGSPVRRPLARADEDGHDRSGSPTVNRLRKNFSSSSLRSMKSRNMSLSNVDETSDMSPGTPSGSAFGMSRAPAVPALPTSASLRERIEASTTGGLHLFDGGFHSRDDPGSPNPSSVDAPVSLEPCPQDFMLRPFWLMRCLYQTLVNPRGGYVSTKLFVPRDVWKVKGVKIKGLEDKIANCDFLTAALLKLARVDTFDADALLEEMQSLEGILEQAQASLTRKLGSEVGVQGSSILFRDAATPADGEVSSGTTKTASGSSKSSSFSWRRLRSKNSGMSLGGSYNSRVAGHEAKDHISIPTLPMVANAVSKPPRRDISLAQFTGPNANYMSSLARLFDAAQAVDAIARQVDDPGLRGADKTQVGLELCTRHAAEFFGFYICRFVLTDLGLLLDKFLKRGSEWVMA